MNKTALPIIHLIDALKTGVINYDLVKAGNNPSEQVKQEKGFECEFEAWKNPFWIFRTALVTPSMQ